jgi:hypothetical protein
MGEDYTLLPISGIHALVHVESVSAATGLSAIRRSLVLAHPPDRISTLATEALEREVRTCIAAGATILRWTLLRGEPT